MSELGPFYPTPTGELQKNQHAWNQIANIVFLESPAFVGWSYSNTTTDIVVGMESLASTMCSNHSFCCASSLVFAGWCLGCSAAAMFLCLNLTALLLLLLLLLSLSVSLSLPMSMSLSLVVVLLLLLSMQLLLMLAAPSQNRLLLFDKCARTASTSPEGRFFSHRHGVVFTSVLADHR